MSYYHLGMITLQILNNCYRLQQTYSW